VRIGHDKVPVEVEAVSAEQITLALGSADLRCLLESDEQQRKTMMIMLLHLPVHPSILAANTHKNKKRNKNKNKNKNNNIKKFMHDPLIKLPESVTLSEDISNTMYCAARWETHTHTHTHTHSHMPYRAIGVIFRALFLMCESRRRDRVESGDTDYIRVGAHEYEALVKQIILLNCGADFSSLPAVTPSPHTVQVYMYICTFFFQLYLLGSF